MVDCRGLLENEGYVCPHGASHGLSPHRKDSLSLILLCGINCSRLFMKGDVTTPGIIPPKTQEITQGGSYQLVVTVVLGMMEYKKKKPKK